MSQISFADTDTASVEASVLTTYEAIAETTLYPGDPVRLFLEAVAYIIATQNNVINMAGLQNLLAYAQGDHLDQVALMVGTQRLSTSPAQCTQKFSLAEPLDFAVLIPQGTRISTGDTKTMFATTASATIAAGETEVEVQAAALTNGTACNGLVMGQINALIDPIAYVVKTENTSMSSFGTDVESDSRLRERAQLAPESFSCAGPVGAYRYHTITAHQDIADAAIWTPVPGTVDIRPILTDGALPTEEILELVRECVNADDVRPLTDTVIVAAPETVDYALSVSWSLLDSDAALSDSISTRIAAAVETYRLWQRSAPGRDINPTKCISLMEQAGARRVVVDFAYTVLEPWQIARESVVQVVFLGVESA